MKKFCLALFLFGNLTSPMVSATTVHTLSQGVTVEYELPVNDPQVFSNIFFWTIKATCTIISDNNQNPISVTMLRKTGMVNDIELLTGDSISLIVQPGDKLNITAISGAKVELLNKGSVLVKASCTTNS